jgi:hypothetical protein
MHSPGLAKRMDVDDKVTVLHDADECPAAAAARRISPTKIMTLIWTVD